MQPHEQINKIPPQVAAKASEMIEDPGYTDSYYSDPNYIAYNYAPTTYSQASAVQQDDTLRCERPVDQGHSRIGYIHDTVMTSSPHPMPSSQSQMNPDEFDDLILDEKDVEAELATESKPTRRPFTPAHEIGNFWPMQRQQYHCPGDLVYAQQVTHYNQDFAGMQRGQFDAPPDEYQRYGYESNTFEMDPETTEIF